MSEYTRADHNKGCYWKGNKRYCKCGQEAPMGACGCFICECGNRLFCITIPMPTGEIRGIRANAVVFDDYYPTEKL